MLSDLKERRQILESLLEIVLREIESGPEAKDLAALVLRAERLSAELDGLPKVSSDGSWEERLEERRRRTG